MALLEVSSVTFIYPGSARKAIDEVSFSVEKGGFLTLCGATGSGKSTLLRLLKRELRPLGELSGSIVFDGRPMDELSPKDSAARIGFVMQRPDEQIVCDKVWHELAFGLENLGIAEGAIRRRVSEMACYFGIEDWFDKNVNELSGGQKQLLNLASVMAMQPEILLLDEPTAQLDPIAASDFINTLAKLNRELGLTIIMIEHRLEEVLSVSDALLALDQGRRVAFSRLPDALKELGAMKEMRAYLPAAARLHARFVTNAPYPINVNQGRRFIEDNFACAGREIPVRESAHTGGVALEFSGAYFRYARELPDVLRSLSFQVYEGEIFCILGGNGCGKSTLLGCAAGINRLYAGSVSVFGKKLKKYAGQALYRGVLALLPQDVQTVFLRPTLREELEGADLGELPFDLAPYLDMHPYDLSGGQQQLAALAIALKQRPCLLLMDEPTKGLDPRTAGMFADVIRALRARGMTVVCVTHDMDFAARIADRCALMFRGEFTACDVPQRFFPDNSFYTTAAERLARGRYAHIATLDDLTEALTLNGGRRAQ